ncbi:MAG: hypothetical protein IJS32_09380 [Kiritimatiellae bacterium]|nr:hypothetical protein [Kiritimatiellia bacterium]
MRPPSDRSSGGVAVRRFSVPGLLPLLARRELFVARWGFRGADGEALAGERLSAMLGFLRARPPLFAPRGAWVRVPWRRTGEGSAFLLGREIAFPRYRGRRILPDGEAGDAVAFAASVTDGRFEDFLHGSQAGGEAENYHLWCGFAAELADAAAAAIAADAGATGFRCAPGYPLLPDATANVAVLRALDAERSLGVAAEPTGMMRPEFSTAGLVFRPSGGV